MYRLDQLTSLEQAASDFGFKWETATQIIAQIRSEVAEIEECLKSQHQDALQEEIGDLMHAVFSLCIFCELNPAQTLTNSITKFERRFNAVKQLAMQDGFHSLNGQSFAVLMAYWDKAKTITATHEI